MFNIKIASCNFINNTGFLHKTNSSAYADTDSTKENLMTSTLISF